MRDAVRTVHDFRPDCAQRCALGREGLHLMHQEATTQAIQRADALHFQLWRCHVDFGGVLHQQHRLLLSHTLSGPFDVGLENLVEGYLVVVEEPVGGLHLGSAAAGRWNAHGGTTAQGGQDRHRASVEPFITEVHTRHFLRGPWRQHSVTPLTDAVLRLFAFSSG